MYNFDEIIDRRHTGALKWESGPDGSSLPEDIIPMWVADMDFPCASPIVDALHKAVDNRVYGYSQYPEGYFDALKDFYARRHNITINEDEILFTAGVVPALQYAVLALTEPGDGVITQTPVYYPFFGVISKGNRVLLDNKLINTDGKYSIDFDDLEKLASDPRAKVMMICSPHNPVGRVWTAEELTKMQEICLRHDLVFLVDEIHHDLIRGGYKHISVMELFPDAQNVICCTAPSKTFNLAGLGVSHMFCRNKEYLKKIAAVRGYPDQNPLSLAAVKAAFTYCDDWIDQLNEYIDGNFDLFYELVEKYFPKAKITKTEGTYLAWVDIRAYTEDSKAVETLLLDKYHVYIECGDAFHGEGFLRINLACPRSYVKEAFDRIKDIKL